MTKLRNTLVALGATLALALPASAQVQAAATARPSLADLKAAAAIHATVPVAVSPCACLKEYVDWAKQSTGKKLYCLTYTFSLVSNSGLVGFSEGWLYWNPSKASFVPANDGDSYYINEYRDPSGRPFQRPALQKNLFTLHANSCTATYKIGTNAAINTPTLLCNNQIYSVQDPSRGLLYAITLKKQTLDIPQ